MLLLIFGPNNQIQATWNSAVVQYHNYGTFHPQNLKNNMWKQVLHFIKLHSTYSTFYYSSAAHFGDHLTKKQHKIDKPLLDTPLSNIFSFWWLVFETSGVNIKAYWNYSNLTIFLFKMLLIFGPNNLNKWKQSL